ncbi:hypothetical protein [Desulforhopalus sp. IMCC35007]|uniref:hypothetical protein n=1 Tax=Desulforhopalus sp. IMCC35007 TaxID=2569543 RepID=UPI0010AECDB6|nr:hypothetical protein [Desulforhopalus sp. IMCC35007]TKB08534.1 hypothetical protein FCL48_12730 [Desulforhopalus sp. IMCC35007]
MTKKNVYAGAGKTAAKIQEKREKSAASAPQHQPMLRAMVWYKEEDYETLLTLFDDAEFLPRTFADWHARAEEKKTEVEAAGDQVMKVFIDPETFPQWCADKNMPKDAASRSQLALEMAQANSFSL